MTAPISADVEAFLRQPHVAALSTVRPDGRPHVTPVWYDFDGREFTVSTFRTTQKLKNVSHKGFAALSIFTHEPPYQNVIVQGTARVGSPLDNVWRQRLATRYLGEHAGRESKRQNEAGMHGLHERRLARAHRRVPPTRGP